jgi:hypothetical protein
MAEVASTDEAPITEADIPAEPLAELAEAPSAEPEAAAEPDGEA